MQHSQRSKSVRTATARLHVCRILLRDTNSVTGSTSTTLQLVFQSTAATSASSKLHVVMKRGSFSKSCTYGKGATARDQNFSAQHKSSHWIDGQSIAGHYSQFSDFTSWENSVVRGDWLLIHGRYSNWVDHSFTSVWVLSTVNGKWNGQFRNGHGKLAYRGPLFAC